MRELFIQNARPVHWACVNVYVSDLNRSHEWYRDVLGLKMTLDPSGRFSEYSELWGGEDKVTIFYLLPDLTEKATHSTVSIALQTSDFAAYVAGLKSAGVQVVREVPRSDTTPVAYATITDPDGHGIVIYES